MLELIVSLAPLVAAIALHIARLPTWLILVVAFSSVPVAVIVILLRAYAIWKRSDDRNLRLQEELKAVRDSRAKLVVVPHNTRDGFYLEVTNHGEQGELEAQITILRGDGSIHGVVQPPNPYIGYWETAVSDKSLLKEGHTDRLLIGQTEHEWRVALVSLKMFFFDRKSKALSSFGTTSWITMGPDKAAPGTVFALRVTISATPRMPDGPFVRDYLVRIGEEEALVESPTAP